MDRLLVKFDLPLESSAIEQYFTVELFIFQFCSGCNFGKFVSCGLDTLSSERLIVRHVESFLLVVSVLDRNHKCVEN